MKAISTDNDQALLDLARDHRQIRRAAIPMDILQEIPAQRVVVAPRDEGSDGFGKGPA